MTIVETICYASEPFIIAFEHYKDSVKVKNAYISKFTIGWHLLVQIGAHENLIENFSIIRFGSVKWKLYEFCNF